MNTLEQLIKDYKLNNSILADITGIKQSSFYEKLYNQRGNKFSPEQKQKIIDYLIKLSDNINNLKTN